MSDFSKHSFTSASTLPAKVIGSPFLGKKIIGGHIPPIHAQIIPTNRCNLKCSFCSCADRDQSLEMPLDMWREAIKLLGAEGCVAMTVTGGGEPLLHPDIEQMLDIAVAHLMGIGLVTNGTMLDALRAVAVYLTWCRVSASDEGDRLGWLGAVVDDHDCVDWALSYVVSSKPDMNNIAKHVQFANDHNLTHIRLVSDLLDAENANATMFDVASEMAKRKICDDLVVYQSRQRHTLGAEKCLISLLKPVIGPDGKIYPCCGVQYAKDDMALDLPDDMSMGIITDIPKIWKEQKPFCGLVCDRCYYDSYNTTLGLMQTPLKHRLFV